MTPAQRKNCEELAKGNVLGGDASDIRAALDFIDELVTEIAFLEDTQSAVLGETNRKLRRLLASHICGCGRYECEKVTAALETVSP